ncbi:MAG TPA: DUF2079 domain-containing protein [Gaiellaceae bacterium]|nr:DUF2079 domain-containing protein [Gaiellaceae bacterium]
MRAVEPHREVVSAAPAGRDVAWPPAGAESSVARLTPAALVALPSLTVVWTAFVAGAAVWRHQQFLSHRFDLGNMVQAVWSTVHGRPLEMTDGSSGEQIVRLAAHVDPILVLLVPFWLVHPGPETLLVVQAAALAAGVYPVVRLALVHTRSQAAALLLGAWYLAFPWIVWAAFNDFHPVVLAVPLLLYAIWFLDRDRPWAFALCAGLALLTGELVGLTVAALGVWCALHYGRRVRGAAIAAAGLGWTALCVAVLLPAFNEGEPSRYYGRFESVGGSPSGLLRTLLSDPGSVLDQLGSAGDLKYVLWLLLPTALLALGQPLLLIVALPQSLVNLLSDYTVMALPWYHYVSAALPALLAATILTIGRLPRRARPPAAGAALVASLAVLAAATPVPGAERFIFDELESAERRAALQQAVALVPAGAPVTATNRVGGQLSARRVIHLFPQTRGAEWAVVDTRDPTGESGRIARLGGFRRLLRPLDREGGPWRLVFAERGVRVYRRAL